MASTRVIATTWDKKTLIAKLKATLKRMDDEISEWEKDHKTYDKRLAAWNKNASKAKEVTTSNGYKGESITIYFDGDVLTEAIGEKPEQNRQPKYKDTNYNQEISDYDQVLNAIALIEGSTDTVFKINTSSVWASFIR
jgi:phosphorylcholine metabolism protein LicD